MYNRLYHETASDFVWFLSSFISTQRHPADCFIIFLEFRESIFLPDSQWTPSSFFPITCPSWTMVLANFIHVLFLYLQLRSSLLGKSEKCSVSLPCNVHFCTTALCSSTLTNFSSPWKWGPQHRIHPPVNHNAVCGRSAQRKALRSASIELHWYIRKENWWNYATHRRKDWFCYWLGKAPCFIWYHWSPVVVG